MVKNHLSVDFLSGGGGVATTGTPSTLAASRALPTRLPSLTGMRFIAALLVFAYHAFLPNPTLRLLANRQTATGAYDLVSQAGGVGVGFFFVLSGFVLTWSARSGDRPGSFWRRRFVKIVPNYVVAWALAMVLFAGAKTGTGVAILHLFMLQSWVPDFKIMFGVNPPGWSLGTEAFFYLLFPVLLLLALRTRPERLKFWIAGVSAAVIATPIVAYLALPSTPPIPGESSVSVSQMWFGYTLPPVRALDFALGILVARAVMTGRWRNIGMVWSSLLLVAGYVLSEYLPYLYGQSAIFIIPSALLIAAAAIADRDGRFTVFRNRTMTWLGEISFAFYLVHAIVLVEWRHLLGKTLYSTPTTFALVLAALAISIVVSWLMYRLVERPITLRWSVSRKNRTASAEARPLH